MKKRMNAVAAGLVLMSGVAPFVFSASAFADTTTSSFATQYQQNASTESSLMATAQASTVSNAETTALSGTVSTISQQVAALYATDQALVTAQASIPKIQPSASPELSNLSHQRLMILASAKREWNLMNEYKRNHNHRAFNAAVHLRTSLMAQLNTINREQSQVELNMRNKTWIGHPYAGGLTSIQQSIFDLQNAEIHYTKEWIAVEKGNTAPPVTTGAVSIAIPTTVTLPAGAPTSISATFVSNGTTVQTVSLPVTALANGSVTFTAPAGLTTGTTYSVTLYLDYNGSVVTTMGSYTA